MKLRFAMAVVVALNAPMPVQAQGADTIESTIQSQIDAFLADDFGRAFTFASKGIKRLFGDPATFGQMVREGYPMVWRPAELRFLGRREAGGKVFQDVMVRDAAGALHMLEYEMIETASGWRINGVRLLEAPDTGV